MSVVLALLRAFGLLLLALCWLLVALFVLGAAVGVVIACLAPWLAPRLALLQARQEAERRAALSPAGRLDEATRAVALVPEELRRELIRRQSIAWGLKPSTENTSFPAVLTAEGTRH